MNEAELEKKIRLHHWDRVCALIGEKLQIESYQYRFENVGRKIDILAYTNSKPAVYYIFELKAGNITSRDIGQAQDYAHLLKAERGLYDGQIKVVLVAKDKLPDKTLTAMLNHFPYENKYLSYKQILKEDENMMELESPTGTFNNFSIAITNMKGGVGKTTTAFVLSCLLAQKGYKVLALDIDPQGSLTNLANIDINKVKYGISDILLDEEGLSNYPDVIKHTPNGFDIIPATLRLASDELRLTVLPYRELLLKQKIVEKVKYDVIIVDVPGTTTTFFQIATISTHKSLLVFETNAMNENSLKQTLQNIRLTKKNFDKEYKLSNLFLGGIPSKMPPITSKIYKTDFPEFKSFLENLGIKVYSPIPNNVEILNIASSKEISSIIRDTKLISPYQEVIKDIEQILHQT